MQKVFCLSMITLLILKLTELKTVPSCLFYTSYIVSITNKAPAVATSLQSAGPKRRRGEVSPIDLPALCITAIHLDKDNGACLKLDPMLQST